MSILTILRPLASACVVFFGKHGAVAETARQRGTPRQSLYREADRVAQTLDGTAAREQRDALRAERDALCQRVAALEARLARALDLSDDRLAHFAAIAQAEGVSLPVGRRLLQPLLPTKAPSVARLGRLARQAARVTTALLPVLDEHSQSRVRQAAGDEIFVGRKPVLMVVEQGSLCWQSGRLVEHRDGSAWAKELGPLSALEQLTCDGGKGLANGLAQVNAQRQEQDQPAIARQPDHFHLLRDGARVVRQLRAQAARTLAAAEAADQATARASRRGQKRTGYVLAAGNRWRAATQAMDRWSAGEKGWGQVREALRLVNAAGEVPTRAQAEAALAAALAPLVGPEWAAAVRPLRRPEVFTYLDGVQQRLAAVPEAGGVKGLLLRAEVLRRRPEAAQGEGVQAAAVRGLLLVAAVALSVGGEGVKQVQAGVRAALAGTWRASSLVEGVNSVLRMQQARHRRLTQGLLDLKRCYWNCRPFRTGKRKGKSPWELLGLTLPPGGWWALLKLTPEQLRQQLSAQKVAA